MHSEQRTVWDDQRIERRSVICNKQGQIFENEHNELKSYLECTGGHQGDEIFVGLWLVLYTKIIFGEKWIIKGRMKTRWPIKFLWQELIESFTQ